jgi:hypothetical protein
MLYYNYTGGIISYKAAAVRDELYELKAIFADEENLKPWERLKLLTGE